MRHKESHRRMHFDPIDGVHLTRTVTPLLHQKRKIVAAGADPPMSMNPTPTVFTRSTLCEPATCPNAGRKLQRLSADRERVRLWQSQVEQDDKRRADDETVNYRDGRRTREVRRHGFKNRPLSMYV